MVDGENSAKPGVSAIRLAARPVGAHNLKSAFKVFKALTRPCTKVVFPEPGPPVITETGAFKTLFIAPICSSDKLIPSEVSMFLPSKTCLGATALCFLIISLNCLHLLESLSKDALVDMTFLFLRSA